MVVLITGCRSGFGLLAAVEAARRGHTVYAGLRDLSTADRLREAAGDLPVIPIQLDVLEEAERSAAIERILSEQGCLDALVNNAGIALGGFLEQVEEDELRRVFEVNVLAVHALTRKALPSLRQSGGIVINISSGSGRMAMPGLGAYAASKFALEGWSEALRLELRPFGVRVALVEPGPFKTDIWERNRNECRNARDPSSPYAPLIEKLDSIVKKRAIETAGDPAIVARRIADLLEAKDPPLRHPLGIEVHAREVLMRVAPYRLWELAVSRILRLPDPQEAGARGAR